MDPEMIAYFDAHFGETSRQFAEVRQRVADVQQNLQQQIAALREETLERFERIDARFEHVDARFEQVDARFEQVDARFEQVDARFEQVDARFERIDARFEQVETTGRHTLVLVEGLRHELQLVAEWGMGVAESLHRYHVESKASFGQVRYWMEPYFRSLKGASDALDIRVTVLEGRAERQDTDHMEVIRRLVLQQRKEREEGAAPAAP